MGAATSPSTRQFFFRSGVMKRRKALCSFSRSASRAANHSRAFAPWHLAIPVAPQGFVSDRRPWTGPEMERGALAEADIGLPPPV
jgi:hypothetical protein